MRGFRALANAARDRTRSAATGRAYANAGQRLSDGLDPAEREAGPSLHSGFGPLIEHVPFECKLAREPNPDTRRHP